MLDDSVADMHEWGKGQWDLAVTLLSEPRGQGVSPERRLDLLDAEADVIDLFRRYHIFYEAGDTERILSLFSDDCVVINPRGTYAGKDAIRANYDYLIGRRRFVIHYGTNPWVRFDNDDFTSGWLIAYYASISHNDAGASWCGGGMYIDRVRKVDGRWEIWQQRITSNWAGVVKNPEAMDPHDIPDPTHEGSSVNLIEAAFGPNNA